MELSAPAMLDTYILSDGELLSFIAHHMLTAQIGLEDDRLETAFAWELHLVSLADDLEKNKAHIISDA